MTIRYGKQDKYLDYTEEDDIRELLMGHKVEHVSVLSGEILLDNGVSLTIEPNDGGCSCGAGDYVLEELNAIDNIITKVEFAEQLKNATGDSDFDTEKRYIIFVYGENRKVNLAQVGGDDGNGYHGTGYYVRVRYPKGDDN